MKKIVIDTNVIISALFWRGYPRMIYDYIRGHKFILLSSNEMEKELIRVLGYPKFGLSSKEIIPIIKNIRGYAKYVDITIRLNAIDIDPTDNIFLECAVCGKADYIISGDRHLLDIREYEGIQILKSRDFLIAEGLLE
ncbi:MAG: putative toxin-antitoxin system toxin component, PIN family [Nitrospirae bacterium]|nr:putative toxin-antitoxin system toxin component, PIN family [Nitrospirota bacterium]